MPSTDINGETMIILNKSEAKWIYMCLQILAQITKLGMPETLLKKLSHNLNLPELL
jgi:hypothetical protein